MHDKVTSSPSSDVTEVVPASHLTLKVGPSERSSETNIIIHISIIIIIITIIIIISSGCEH